MNRRCGLKTGVAMMLLAWPGFGLAQATTVEITFQVPLNLVNLTNDITQVAVRCVLDQGYSFNYQGETVVPVTNGRVVTTVDVVISIPASAAPSTFTGQRGSYTCSIKAQVQGGPWEDFNDNISRNIPPALSPRPHPITGTFTW